MKRAGPQFVVCVKNKQYGVSLELRKPYQVVPDEGAAKHRQLRVIDESGEDYLYPESYFVAANVPQSAEKAVLRATNLVSARRLARLSRDPTFANNRQMWATRHPPPATRGPMFSHEAVIYVGENQEQLSVGSGRLSEKADPPRAEARS